ncbi:MAG: WD40 repeat domain-containing protein [Chthoniobacteraceae bacterium]
MSAKPPEPHAELIKACPYRGLVPYFEEDADYFFGRQNDTQIILANCMTTRVTLFYGASGVGKSSVLYAGVMRELHRRALANLQQRDCPECVGVAFSSWRDDPVAGLLERVEESLRKLLPADWLAELPPRAATLPETLRAWTQFMQSDFVLLLDQFEEYFLYRDAHDTSFEDELVAIVNDPELRVNVLISLREDALARLDTLKANIPSLFSNGLRLEHLTMDSARLAIEGPLKLYNDRLPPSAPRLTIDPALIEELLSQLKAGRVRLRKLGMGAVRFGSGIVDHTARVEAPYLQMVMMRLWREDIARGSQAMRLATLVALGGAEQILRSHLDVVMAQLPAAEQALAARVFHYLVTPGGTKIAHYVSDLAAFAQAPVANVARMCALLEEWKARVLRDVTPPGMDSKRYEIFHDLLAAPILDWRQRYEMDEARKKWVLRIGAAFLLCSLLAAWITYQASINATKAAQDTAQHAAAKAQRTAEADKTAAVTKIVEQKNAEIVKAVVGFATDEIAIKEDAHQPTPVLSTEPAVPDFPKAKPGNATLEGAVEFSTTKVDANHKRDVWNADYGKFPDPAHPGRLKAFLITAGKDKTAFVMDLEGDGDFALKGHTDEVNAALINPNPDAASGGWFAATASDDSTARVWKFGTSRDSKVLKHKTPLTGLVWSRDGRWLVTTSKGKDDIKGLAMIWDLTGDLNNPAKILTESTGSIWQSALSDPKHGTDGHSWLVTPSSDGKAYVYSFPDGMLSHRLDHGAPVRRAAITPDGRFVVTAGADGRAILWDLQKSDEKPAVVVVHAKAVRDVTFDSAGHYFATGSDDGSAQIWDTQNLKGIVTLAGHTAPIYSIAFTPRGPGLVTTSWDRTARIWNFAEKRCIAICTGHTNVLWSTKFDLTGNKFCTTSADGTTRIWELKAIPGTEALRAK